jgi:hypothetical protein
VQKGFFKGFLGKNGELARQMSSDGDKRLGLGS